MENGSVPPKTESLVSRMALNDNKAGMEGLDRDKINKIIMESSKGSKFYENEVKREQQVNQRIEKMMLQKEQITEQHLKKAQAQVARMVAELEKRRDLTRVIVHVDMDAFYAAVEMRDCPELKDKPMAVGSMSMLSTSNYHARKYGVRAAMPGFIARKLCPNLVIVPTNFDKYRAVSSEIREIFADYDPNFMPMSLDEAYLDFTEHLEKRQSWPDSLRTHHYRASSNSKGDESNELPQETTPDTTDLSPVLFDDSPSSPLCCEDAGSAFEIFGTSVEEAVREMRFRIEQKTLLTASAGIAPNMMLAKVCSDKNKPNGQYRLSSTREAVMEFVCNLPVRKVSGIGKVSEKLLNALGISSCSHLGQKMALLSLLFSETAWHHFLEVSLGLGSAFIPRHEERKSMSTERTFKEISTVEEQLSLCRELCEDLANDLKKEGLKGKTVTLKLKNVNFEVKTRALTLSYPVATADEIFAVAKDLLKTERDNESPQPLRLRLMGVRISAFVSSDEKQPLQKSIVGFLNSGKAELGPSHKEITRYQNDQLSGSSKIWPLLCQRSGESEEKTTLEGPQQSFFQRARAKRLQLQAAAASSRQEDSSGISSPPLQDAGICAASDEPDNERGASASTSDGVGLSCPVCFRRVETADLAVFNRHIDRCLSVSSAQKPSQHLEEGDGGEAKKAESSGGFNGIGSLGSTSAETASSVNGNDRKSSSLVCPICLLTQDNDDLIMFNRHVDLCLNQGVLHKLQSETPSPINPPSAPNSKALGKGQLRLAQAGKGKTKRRDSPSSPPSKKAKGSHITIDHFFSVDRKCTSADDFHDHMVKFNMGTGVCCLLFAYQRALRAMVEKHRLQRYDPSIPKLGKREHLKEFGDLLLHPHQEKDTENAFDNNEMLLKAEKQFMEAAKNNDVESMKVVGRGLNVNAKNVNDRTALHYAVAGKNKEAVQFLLQRRIKVDQKDKFGVAPIHLAAWFGSLEILKLLVQAGAEQKVENEDGLNIMHCAAVNNHTDIVEYIINDLQMKELDKEDNSGNRAFGLAAENGCVDMLEMLREQYNMDTMKPNQAGDTPLHLAASNGHLDTVHLLLLHFDTRDEANAEGETALFQAIDNGHEECALTLLKAGCKPNVFMEKSSVLHPVSERGDTSFVQLLLDYKADTNARNQDQEAPLHLAVRNNHIPVIHCLLSAGCDTNAIDKRSQTPLHVAADLAKIDIVEMLLKAEFDQTIQDKQGKTVLGVAARADEAVIVDMIIKAERYYAWRKANPELNEPVYSQFPLTFKPDHRVETKQFRSMVWRLAYELLKPADWKRLAEHWGFTKMQMSAIEQQWTGQHSYKEHGNRMLLVWLHGAELAGTSPAKELYQALISTGNSKAADKIRMEEEKDKSRNCNIS